MRHFALSSAIVLQVSGKDCARYLEARLTNKVKALNPGEGMLAAALTPQGKTQAFFSVYMLEAAHYLLLCDGWQRSAIIQALKQYIVADRVDVLDRTDLMSVVRVYSNGAAHTLAERIKIAQLDRPGMHCDAAPFGFCCARSQTSQAIIDLVSKKEDITKLLTYLSELGSRPLDESSYLLARLQSNQLAFPDEIRPDTLFAEAAPPESVSYNKGCYVGQEVIEKIASLGKTARAVKRLQVSGQVPIGDGTAVFEHDAQNLHADPKALGKVLSAAYEADNNRTLCFAQLRNQSSYSQIRINEIVAQII